MGQLEDQTAYDLVDQLFEMAVRGYWHAVVEAYAHLSNLISNNCDIASAKCETALHVAVAEASEETEHVSEIMEVIPPGDLPKILTMRNCRGNTPLHLAAAMGKTDICWLIASKGKSLIAERNEQGETPLFLAAHRGHEDAFFYLEFEFANKDVPMDMLKNKSDNKKDVPMDMLINKSGDTVLHSAISGQNYRLAIRILESYPYLVNNRNNKGLTPLHVLALQRQSFASSYFHQGLFDHIFYLCMIIRKETWEDRKDIKDIKEIVDNRNSPKYPKNYRTCFDIYEMLKGFFVKTRPLLKSCRGCGPSGEGIDPDMEAGGNVRYLRKKEKRFTEKRGPSTTICDLLYQIFTFISLVPLYFLVRDWLRSIANKKRRHKLAGQLLNELLDKTVSCKVAEEGKTSASSTSETTVNAPPQAGTATSTPGKKQVQEQQQQQKRGRKFKRMKLEQSSEPFARGETPLLTAARLGIVEVVHAILTRFPGAIQDKDHQGKNAVLLAAENRRARVYWLLDDMIMLKESIFCQVDADGNSALHLASLYNPNRRWITPGPVLQMKWEIIWHLCIKTSMPLNFFPLRNNDQKTAEEIFIKSHTPLRKEGKHWLTTICTSYSVISTLIAAAALATSLNIPGGYNYGTPEFESELAFNVFSISSVVALCTSMSALVFFMTILTTQDELEDFAMKIPNRLKFGLIFLFASIASMLVSFSSSFYFSVRNKLQHAAYPIFMAMCLPVTLFVAEQLPLYLRYSLKMPQLYDQDIYVH